MPQSPRPTRRTTRLTRPHSGQSLDPTLTRKGKLAHPGSLLIGFAAIFFFIYIFNLGGLQTWLDGLFDGVNAKAQSHNETVARGVIASLPYLGALVGALALFIVLMLFGRGAQTVRKKRRLATREEVSLHEFIDAAEAEGVSAKVAREAYKLLLPLCHNQMRVRLNDRMMTALGLRPVEVTDLHANLLKNTDRQQKLGDDGATIETVLELLQAVEAAKVRSLSESTLLERDALADMQTLHAVVQRSSQSLRSGVRKAAEAVDSSPLVIKPARLPVKELDMKPKTPPRGGSRA